MAKKILIVDDVELNRMIMKEGLQNEYDILESENGLEALDIIRKNHKILSAVITDVKMPLMDGYELLSAVRENPILSGLPIIVATGSDDEASRVKALALGANDFIVKPYNHDIIKHCLRNNIALHETMSMINAIKNDKLTGIYNREFFFEEAENIYKSKENSSYILACFDIDNFKIVNDRYGTAEGDMILKHIGSALKTVCNEENAVCGRISGDNFAVLFPNIPEVVERMKESRLDGLLPKITETSLRLSVGWYIITDSSLSASILYDRACIAKQSVKGRYDKQIAVFDDSMFNIIVKEHQITSDMVNALSGHQFEVWFQPQYNHTNGSIIGAEALARWRHPTKGMISPGDFIPVFEANGFIYELDKYIWEETCRYLRKWIDEGRDPLPVSVNISRYDIFKEDLIDVLTGLCKKYRIPIDIFRLEITESAFSKFPEQVVNIAELLISEGFTIEIDDFGSGYSSLNILKDVPAQILKLDMKFIDNSSTSGRGGNIIESVVRMAKWLGMAVIAEGVETYEQADFLKSIGCNYIQGYLYARPMPANEYEMLSKDLKKEKKLITVETVLNMDNDTFWKPESIDTLIFNSYVGAACIYEYNNGKIELIRANDKYIRLIGSVGLTMEKALRLDWAEYLDKDTLQKIVLRMHESKVKNEDVSMEYTFRDIPGCPPLIHIRSLLRVIASVGNRHLVYSVDEDMTAAYDDFECCKPCFSISDKCQKVFDSISDGIAVIKKENGKFSLCYSNEVIRELFKSNPVKSADENKDILESICRLCDGSFEIYFDKASVSDEICEFGIKTIVCGGKKISVLVKAYGMQSNSGEENPVIFILNKDDSELS